MLHLRHLERPEIEQIWQIDRSEVHHHIYRLEGDALVRIPAYYDLRGWPPEQIAEDTPKLYACFDRGGSFIGMFDGHQLIGIAVVDTILLGSAKDHLQLKYLYVSQVYRQQGIGRTLFREAQVVARAQGAKMLYISATPTENTINFYLGCGATLAAEPDVDLYALEPEDIHLVCNV